MFNQNISALRLSFPEIANYLESNMHSLKNEPYVIEESKLGLPTLKSEEDNQYIHSKYDPVKEAERIIEKYINNIHDNSHVLFYGVGLAYHIELFGELFPETSFSIYEPSAPIFYNLLSSRSLQGLKLNRLNNIYLGTSTNAMQLHLNHFAGTIFGDVVLIVLPSYSKIFAEDCNYFIEKFKDVIEARVYNIGVDFHFSKRWALNSLMNLPTTLSTPNFIREKKEFFQGKPVLIVSAGPSLHEEYENLRYIKKKGLAYIFAVGSANKALIANDILPDAVCTYDPQEHNFAIYRGFKEKKIDNVPLIYGSSVGYETIKNYPGPKLHFITSQDTVTPYYDRSIKNEEIVNDAFSIAIVTLELLARIEVGLVVLVGQNFAFKDNLFYSKGIYRGKEEGPEIKNEDMTDLVLVEDVFGNKVRSNAALNQMRMLMQTYISEHKDIEIINTTNGGAKILGSQFQRLEQVIKDRLKEKVVVKDWHAFNNDKKDNQVLSDIDKTNRAACNFVKIHKGIVSCLKEFEGLINRNKGDKINGLFSKFDNLINRLLVNEFYSVYVGPVTRIHFEILQKSVDKIKEEVDPIKKASNVISEFRPYLEVCRNTFNEFLPIVKDIISQKVTATNGNMNWKRYASTSGEIYYSKDWTQREILIKRKSLLDDVVYMYQYSDKKKSTIKFKFKGTSLRILGGKHHKCSTKIGIKIDGYSQTFSSKDFLYEGNYSINFQEILFEKKGLVDKVHDVEITLLEDEIFVFDGIELNSTGRLLHIKEVLDVKELKIGKRIRCHYKATLNCAGEFSYLGEETNSLIPLDSSSHPKGDFYLIMVAAQDEKKVLIADRNIQHSISWETLDDSGYTVGKVISVSDIQMQIRLIKGGNAFIDENNNKTLVNLNNGIWPRENEWDMYVKPEEFLWENVASWCLEAPSKGFENTWYDGVTKRMVTEDQALKARIVRGKLQSDFISSVVKHAARRHEGFRPLVII